MKLIFTDWFFIFILMTAAWAIYLKLKNPGIIDVFWSISITLSGLYFLSSTEMTHIQMCFGILLVAWCLRLSGHLFITRIIPNLKEKRYDTLSKKWKLPPHIGFFLHYQLQGILAIIIAIPFLWIRHLESVNLLTIFSMLMVIIGIIGETIADYQLHQFKQSKSQGVCTKGLWNYSRHPNYFFEAAIWVGFGISCLSVSTTALFALISPTLLLFIMLAITGPITEEQSLSSRGESFKKYQESTSYFMPLPKRKS